MLSFTITVGQDFTLSRNKVTFDLGANDGNSVTVLADILDDCLVEGTECFTLSGGIGSPAAPGAVFIGDPVTICIPDNDSKCVFVWSHATAVSSIKLVVGIFQKAIKISDNFILDYSLVEYHQIEVMIAGRKQLWSTNYCLCCSILASSCSPCVIWWWCSQFFYVALLFFAS